MSFVIDGQFVQSDKYSTTEIFDQAIDQLESFDAQNDDRPFYLHIAPFTPHRPFDPEPQYANASVPAWDVPPSVGEADRTDKPNFVSFTNVTQEESADVRRQQLRMLMSVDDQMEKLIDRLTALGEADNTVFILSLIHI